MSAESSSSDPVTPTDINYYQPNEADPVIVNPDYGTSAEGPEKIYNRTIPASVTAEIEPGIGYVADLKVVTHNDYRMGMYTQPALYFHLESAEKLEPNETVAVRIKGLHVSGKAGDPDRTAKLLIQHDVGNDQKDDSGQADIDVSDGMPWNKTVGQGRPDITLSATPTKTYILYPEPSTQFSPPLYEATEAKPLLTYTIQAQKEKIIIPGKKQNLQFVVHNPEPSGGKGVKVAALGLYVKATDDGLAGSVPQNSGEGRPVQWAPGQEALCKKSDLTRIGLASTHQTGFKCSNTESTTAQYLSQDPKEREGLSFLGLFQATTKHGTHTYEVLKPGESFSFDLNGVIVSDTSGEGILKVVELTWPENETKVTRNLARGIFTKFGGGFFFDYFTYLGSEKYSEIAKNTATRLVWSAENVKQYKMFADEKKDPKPKTDTPNPKDQYWETSNLQDSTGYYLQATSKEDLVHARQVVVPVRNPTSTFHNVTVNAALDLDSTTYKALTEKRFTSNDNVKSWTVAEPEKIDNHEGDRYVVFGISKFDGTDPEANARFVLHLEKKNSDKKEVGRVFADPGRTSPVGVRVPAEATLSVSFEHDKLSRTVDVTIGTLIASPRILPPPAH
ncbi:hypothetical protein [Streptomyces sp. NPDC002537]